MLLNPCLDHNRRSVHVIDTQSMLGGGDSFVEYRGATSYLITKQIIL